MRLLRDADKLDIWKLFIDYYNEREKNHSSAVELGLPKEIKEAVQHAHAM